MAPLLRRLFSLALLLLAVACAAPGPLLAQEPEGPTEGPTGEGPAEGMDEEAMQRLDAAYQKAERAILDRDYEAAIGAYEEFFRLLAASSLPQDIKNNAECGARYNLACACALTGKKEQALTAFARAVELGFWDWEHIGKDSDLDSIRAEPAFLAAVEKGKEAEQKNAEELVRKATEEATAALAGEPLFPFDFNVTTIDGKQLKLADLKGKVVIVDVWGTWCPPCRAEIPHFKKLYEQYKDQGLEIVGLACEQVAADEALAAVKAFAEQHKVPYPLATIEQDDPVLQAIPDFDAFPTTLWIDRDGKVRLKRVGYHDYAPLEGLTKPLLAAKTKE